MALKKTIVALDNFGVEVSLKDCYIKVSNVQFSKAGCKAFVTVYSADQSVQHFREEHDFVGDYAGDKNALEQAYQHIKQLSKFAGAMDC